MGESVAMHVAWTGLRWIGRIGVASVFAGALVIGVSFLHERKATLEAEQIALPEPIPVETADITRADAYHVAERYVGRLETARRVEMAFELAGVVDQVYFDEGDVISAGDLIATIDTARLRAERERLLSDRRRISAALELAELTEERQRTLQTQGHVSSQAYDEARLATTAVLAEIGTVDAAIRRLDVDLEKSNLYAPFGGTVSERSVDSGTVVSPGMAVLNILETGRPQARIGVPADVAASLQVGHAVTLWLDGAERLALVAAIRPDMDVATRTVGILFDVETQPEDRIGEVVSFRVERSVPTQGFWIPTTALSVGERGLWTVLVMQEDDEHSIARRAAVEVVHTSGEHAYVSGPLGLETTIVLGGWNRIVPGQAIVAVDAVDTAQHSAIAAE